MNEPDPPKKSKFTESWKSLAGNLFGVQFDGSSDLEDIDIDSVAEVVEQLNPTGKVASTSNVIASFDDEEDLSFGSDNDDDVSQEREKSVVQSDKVPSRTPSTNTEDSELPEIVSENRASMPETSEKSFDRATFEDEDPFGFGIAEEEMVDFEEDDSTETDEQVSKKTATSTPSEQPREEDLSFDDLFDFEADEDKPAAEAKKVEAELPAQSLEKPSRRRKRSSGTSKSSTRSESDSNKEETTADNSHLKEATRADDGFWDSLSDWDSDAPASSPKKEEKKHPPRRTATSRRDAEPVKAIEEEVAAETEEDSNPEQTEQESRPKRSRRRRRRPSQSRQDEKRTEEVTSESSDKIEEEVASEDIDLLWGNDDDAEEVVLPASRQKSGDSQRDSKRSEADSPEGEKTRGRRKRSSQAPESQSGETTKADVEVENRDSDRSKASSQTYKNIPTWIEAIEMVVRKKDPHSGRQRSGGRRSGGARPSTRKRTSRRREDS